MQMILFAATLNQYRVVTYTGDELNAGTDASVYIILFGDEGESAQQSLDNAKNNFEKGR